MRLPRGIPNAVSRVGFYALVTFGFLLALTAAGVPLDRLAILTGAFGVGIGFGLQDVVNNFISGIILMFERPIQPGDKIEFGTRSGIVKQIGIRSSVVRTYEGADVNVPNSHLISNEVTNWTKDDDLRRVDVNISVAHGTQPARVAETLLRVASSDERVRIDPAPDVTLVKFRDIGFDMSLRCWPVEPAEWWGLKTELAYLAYEALEKEGIEFPLARVGAGEKEISLLGKVIGPSSSPDDDS
jgi:small-conductance mechanosensitive channel